MRTVTAIILASLLAACSTTNCVIVSGQTFCGQNGNPPNCSWSTVGSHKVLTCDGKVVLTL